MKPTPEQLAPSTGGSTSATNAGKAAASSTATSSAPAVASPATASGPADSALGEPSSVEQRLEIGKFLALVLPKDKLETRAESAKPSNRSPIDAILISSSLPDRQLEMLLLEMLCGRLCAEDGDNLIGVRTTHEAWLLLEAKYDSGLLFEEILLLDELDALVLETNPDLTEYSCFMDAYMTSTPGSRTTS
jgi:hypothetical protein